MGEEASLGELKSQQRSCLHIYKIVSTVRTLLRSKKIHVCTIPVSFVAKDLVGWLFCV